MTRRTRTQQDQAQWQAQRDERISDLMRQLEAGVQAIQTSADFQRYLRTAATFHQYRCPCRGRTAGMKIWYAPRARLASRSLLGWCCEPEVQIDLDAFWHTAVWYPAQPGSTYVSFCN